MTSVEEHVEMGSQSDASLSQSDGDGDADQVDDRVSSGGAPGPTDDKSGKRRKGKTPTRTTSAQRNFLLHYFEKDRFPDIKKIEAIAAHLKMTLLSVRYWFQNTRAKLRRSQNKHRDAKLGTEDSMANPSNAIFAAHALSNLSAPPTTNDEFSRERQPNHFASPSRPMSMQPSQISQSQQYIIQAMRQHQANAAKGAAQGAQ